MTTDILLVEDDQDLREEVAAFLRYRGFGVRECGSVAEAAAKVREAPPSAAILDVLLPDGSGLSLLPVLRSEFPQCVNLVLSARSEIAFKLDAFAWGADGYMVKPVDLRELVAQLNAIFKRVSNEPSPGWLVQSGAPIISGPRGASLTVSLQEASLLRVMAASRDQFATRRELIEALGHDYLEYDEQRLEAMISRLRRKLAPLGDNPIKAEHGRGYIFTQPIRLA